MIPILFAANETAFTSNGIGRLTDATRCEITEERNGQYELVLEYPVTGKLAAEIQTGRYIYATHDDSKKPQAFQIYQVTNPAEGMITANAWHISYALNTIICEPFTAGSCTQAIAGVKTHSMNTNPFTFWTDKSVTADFELKVPASARAVLGGMQGSILDIYGKGEYEFDMYTVKLHLNRGANRGVSIRYGKNLTSLDQTLDASNVYNSCVPYWTNDETTVVSDSIITRTGETAQRTIALDLSNEFDEAPTLVALKARAQSKIDASTNYILKENLKVDFVALWQTEEYKSMASLQRVFLCDTVNIFYEKLGINVTAQCIKVVYDSLKESYVSMELGEPSTSLIQQIRTEVVGDILESVPTKSSVQAAIDHATELIGGGFGGYIKFNYLSDGTPSEMLVMDSPDESTAVNIIKLNQNGLGFSTDGGTTYANAWTIDGNLNATFITTGVLDADLLTAGMIQDSSGENYWNLDTGEFVTKQGEIADFDIQQDQLIGGNYGFNNTGTRIKQGSFSTTSLHPYTISGQMQLYTHFSGYGSEVSFYITDPSRTTYPLLTTELAGRIVPNYNATLDFRELKLYGGSNEMIDLRATSNPYIYVNKRMQIGASTNMLVNNLFGSLQIRKDTGTDGTYLSGKGAAFGKSAITDNLVDSAWKLKTSASGMDGVLVSHGEVADAGVKTYRTDINKGVSLVTGASGNRGIYLNGENQWLFMYDGTDVNIPYAVNIGNFKHGYAGNAQYQKIVANRYVTGNLTWDGVSGTQLSAPVDGLYAIVATATYNNSEPSGVAINIRASGQTYNNFSAVTDRTSCGLGIGITQYLRTSCLHYMKAGDVANAFVRYASAAYNDIILEMWLL